jgi:hypothetical protein
MYKARKILSLKSHHSRDVKVVRDDVQFKKRKEILEWLSPASFITRHEELQKTRAENSGKWFVESEEFVQWMEGKGPNALLCTGIRLS